LKAEAAEEMKEGVQGEVEGGNDVDAGGGGSCGVAAARDGCSTHPAAGEGSGGSDVTREAPTDPEFVQMQEQEQQATAEASIASAAAVASAPPPMIEVTATLHVGSVVLISGLVSKPELNGTEAVIQQAKGERWVVLPAGSCPAIALKPFNITPLAGYNSNGTGVNSEGDGDTGYYAWYTSICFELLYCFKSSPEQAAEYDAGWVRGQLLLSDYAVDDSDDDELEFMFADAAEIYEDYENQRLAQALLDSPSKLQSGCGPLIFLLTLACFWPLGCYLIHLL
jgi:hypothetical protein